WAPKFADIGCKVVDNSSAWRMESYINLVVPEINGDRLSEKDRIIANPNCSTIQLLMALAPIHREFNVKRVIVSTYQSVTGTGKAAVDQLENEEQGKKGEMAYPYAIYRNALPHCDVFQDNDYTKEEMKLTRETKKILDDNIDLTATAVRIPVEGGHGESVHIELEREADVKKIKELLNNTKGVVLQDQPEINKYPMPIYSHGKDDVFVGRIRKDFTRENAYHLWIVADNLRKGAATNAVQIAEKLLEKGLL
ncbi:MAG: aspartate-semialdehyde dehydrogenase, partial [Psychroflexus sp.]|nr:aspartate-semialdehyde dehydrogenase [Psychroflexus sp.]